MPSIQSRRHFLASLTAGAAGVLGARRSLADEGPPETTTIRLFREASVCRGSAWSTARRQPDPHHPTRSGPVAPNVRPSDRLSFPIP